MMSDSSDTEIQHSAEKNGGSHEPHETMQSTETYECNTCGTEKTADHFLEGESDCNECLDVTPHHALPDMIGNAIVAHRPVTVACGNYTVTRDETGVIEMYRTVARANSKAVLPECDRIEETIGGYAALVSVGGVEAPSGG